MNKKMSKRQRDIKTKLMAAVAMLLVSSIMMVSTTYAWFTLSTAPEVTGITTAVGANGNLEMALLPASGETDGITSNAGDSTEAWNIKNTTWGNLVDLSSNEFYGMDKLVLYPSALNYASEATDTSAAKLAETLLQTPAYGADGRVSELLQNTITSTYNTTSKNFPANSEYGVRAVGVASGMTDRQLAYRNARSAASTAMSQAKIYASQSLNTNGAALANIAMAHAVDANATHTKEDVGNLLAIVNDLLGTDDEKGVLEYIETAYIQYLYALGASAKTGETDVGYSAVKTMVDEGKTALEIATALETYSSDAATVKTWITKLNTTKETVEGVQADLQTLYENTAEDETTDAGKVAWSDISPLLYKLADTDAMEVNDIPVSQVKDRMSELVSSVTGGAGLTVAIATGGGVYADVADHCGDFNAQITIKEVSYGGVTLNDMPARMETKSTVPPAYLAQLGGIAEAAKAPQGTGGQVMPITDMYGYIIDLAFRTNAAESNLLLQTEAEDRIYSENAADAETMGHGSTMTFTATTPDFTTDQMQGLMSAIRVVFYNKTNNEVMALAKLDMDENNVTVVGGNTVTANLHLYEVSDGSSKTEYIQATYIADASAEGGYKTVTGAEVATHAKIGESYVAATHVVDDATAGTYKQAGTGETATHVENTTTVPAGEYLIREKADAVITALTQNQPATVSVLVYLDGKNVGNDDVAATAATSMTGTMNLQFASSANLVPMEYTALMSQGTTETPDANGGTSG